ncbi:MAG TPA: ribonuclease activity regulator RraA [Acidisoma sp.]|uniref:ribonuclease activity regulator RraA n=1 Tax=Acidisoma sp. TaxID=1872115 RepID=UPI002BA6FD3A|nr:ribonuclease activity regulator RraA [Acidisoma sp.]HTI00871.1 ribonuclease activity regulator RraA [Acidisoma sp.]
MSNEPGAPTAPMAPLDPSIRAVLSNLSTASITMALLKSGLRNVWIRGARSIEPDYPRVVGRAFTLRFVPAREDLATPESLSSARSTRGAMDVIPEGCIAVADAMGITDAGIFGDILCARMKYRGAAALVTDGAVRDLDGVRKTGLPTWCNGVAAPPSVTGLTFVGWQEPIGCGGVAIFPDDVIVLDADGAVVIPNSLVDQVVKTAPHAEVFEAWVLQRVEEGRKLMGLYPPSDETIEEFQAWQRERS